MKIRSALFLLSLLFAVPTFAQNVKNPSVAEFNSPDHGNTAVTGYELDINVSTPTGAGAVIQTITVPKANVVLVSGVVGEATALYRVSINVQPVAFGTYVSAMRTVAGAIKSDNSPLSNIWDRSPGAPSKPAVK
jgi:hypothetical protein